jgi:hypothetical protein
MEKQSLSILAIASARWDNAAAALMVRDYPTFDREIAAFKRISSTWNTRDGSAAQEAAPSNSR